MFQGSRSLLCPFLQLKCDGPVAQSPIEREINIILVVTPTVNDPQHDQFMGIFNGFHAIYRTQNGRFMALSQSPHHQTRCRSGLPHGLQQQQGMLPPYGLCTSTCSSTVGNRIRLHPGVHHGIKKSQSLSPLTSLLTGIDGTAVSESIGKGACRWQKVEELQRLPVLAKRC